MMSMNVFWNQQRPSDSTHVINKLILSQPISVEANRKYHISVRYSCPKHSGILYGTRYNEVVHSSDKEPIKVTFSVSSYDKFNGDDRSGGPLPSLHFCR